jgi:hypothetical protein
MKHTRSAMAGMPRPSLLISVLDDFLEFEVRHLPQSP